ncbi:TetR/AcrR family transcriptional regulator [Acrocarpospora pleiomorpha]|nr:TetR/AcrR family transcriptional regulator [Acrocarpospora pleiomorpha]
MRDNGAAVPPRRYQPSRDKEIFPISRSSTPSHPRRRLGTPAIIAEALRLVREDGLAAVTMRRLADELGTAPMSLYRHVADRQALLILMLDEVAAGIRLPPPVGDPRSEITVVLTAIHDALRCDSWAVRLIVTDKLAGPSIVPVLERLFSALRRAGLAPRDCMVAYALLWHYIAGELLDAHPGAANDAFSRELVRAADPLTYPALAEAVAAFPPGPPGDWFTENLQRLLDGLLPPTVAR